MPAGVPGADPGNLRHRFWVSAVTIAAILVYMGWRIVATIPLDTPLLAALCIGFLGLELVSSVGEIMVMRVLTRYRNRSADAIANQGWLRETQPSAAIFICTYNEDATILERTITGARNQSYGAKIYVLDDGRRPEIAALCRRRGVEWLTRPDNRHAKAGNMNAGIATLAARGELPEFVAILDADFVALPDFMAKALPLLRDPRVGVVQTPQHFFNPDPLQHRIRGHLDLPDEQRYFFDTLLPAKDGWETAFSCGTSSIVRVEALRAIGGFPTDSVTEDMLLSIRMKRYGFITAHLNEKLSLGLAPEGVGEYCTQRVRWSVGAMQIMRGPDGLWRGSGLSLNDRLSLLDTLLYWTGSFTFRLVCLLTPILFWTTGLTVMHASTADLATFLLPRMLIGSFAIAWFSNGRIMPLLTDVQQLLIAPEIIMASLHTLLFPGERPFKVTDKGGDRLRTVIHWRGLMRFGTVLVLTAFGLLASYYTPLAPTFFSEQKDIVAFWSIYNVLLCLIGIIICIEKPRRAAERVPISGEAVFEEGGRARAIQLVDISSSGLAIAYQEGWTVGEAGTVRLRELGAFEAVVARISEKVIGMRIVLSPDQQAALTTFQFSEQRMRTPEVSVARSFIALVRGLVAH